MTKYINKRNMLSKFVWLVLLMMAFFFAAWGTGVLGYFFKLIN